MNDIRWTTTIFSKHFRSGFFTDVVLSTWGDPSSADPSIGQCGESDGLWTGILLAAESARFAVTGNVTAFDRAYKAFRGLELLHNVTGISGLIARSAARFTHGQTGTNWCTWNQSKPLPAPIGSINKCILNSTAMPGWIFMSSISSDSMVGNIFGYALFHDFIANATLKDDLLSAGDGNTLRKISTLNISSIAVRKIMSAVMNYILDNNWCVVDLDGRCTYWAQWSPTLMNDDAAWFEERGLNSAMIIGFLLAAFSVTREDRFAEALSSLVIEHDFDVNIINQVKNSITEERIICIHLTFP